VPLAIPLKKGKEEKKGKKKGEKGNEEMDIVSKRK
jgi:hypothetical protein